MSSHLVKGIFYLIIYINDALCENKPTECTGKTEDDQTPYSFMFQDIDALFYTISQETELGTNLIMSSHWTIIFVS